MGTFSVQNRLDGQHRTLRDCPVAFLLPHRPHCSPSSQTKPICTEKPPRTIDEAPNHINRTGIEKLLCDTFGISKGSLRNLTITVLAPTPVLSSTDSMSAAVYQRINAYHFDRVELTMKLRKKKTEVSSSGDEGLMK